MTLRQIESHYRLIEGLHAEIDIYRAGISDRLNHSLVERRLAPTSYYQSRVEQAEALEGSAAALSVRTREVGDTITGHHEAIRILSEGLDVEALRLLVGN